MSSPFLRAGRLAAGAAAAAASLAAAPAALAAPAVFGGSTSTGDPIVLQSDAATAKLKSAVVPWIAKCSDGRMFPVSIAVTAVAPTPGFTPQYRDLAMSRNAKGRFAGTELGGWDLGDAAAAISAQIAGKLTPARASGTLSVDIKIVNKQTGAEVGSCRSGNVRWAAARQPGTVYAGKTSQEEPFVARIDAKRKKVTDLLMGWSTNSCASGNGFRFHEHFSNFLLKPAGGFGDSWEEKFTRDAGGDRRFGYQLTGRITRTKASGSLKVTVADTDAAGAAADSCDTGAITWKAITG